jgi:adenylyl cyclase-associated protein
MASAHVKPASANGLAPLLKPQADEIGAIMEAKDKLGRGKEGREWAACLSVMGEGVGAWGWVQVVSANSTHHAQRCIVVVCADMTQEPAPAPFVGEMKNAAQFWADRVTKQFKETSVADF